MPEDILENAKGRPSCVAVVICNEVIEDKLTNNKTLVSLFNEIHVANLPAQHPRMFVMASLTDGLGIWPVSLTIRAPSGASVFDATGQIDLPQPEVVIDFVVELRGLPLLETGTYYVDVLVDRAPVAYRRFVVKMAEQREEGRKS